MSIQSMMPTDLPTPEGGPISARTRKVSFYLSVEAIRALGVVAVMTDSDKSKVVEAIIAESPALERWSVSYRDAPAVPFMAQPSSIKKPRGKK
jgi:hypothetical protein